MAILTKPGALDANHSLTDGTTVSTNVIDLGAFGIYGMAAGITNWWLDVETSVAEGVSSGATSTYQMRLCLDDTEACDSIVYEVLSVLMAQNDPRIDTAGAKIYSGPLPDQIWQLARLGYRYLGINWVLANGNGTAALSVNAQISPSKPQTTLNTQVIRSNVGVPS